MAWSLHFLCSMITITGNSLFRFKRIICILIIFHSYVSAHAHSPFNCMGELLGITDHSKVLPRTGLYLYRAITGKGRMVGNEYIHDGITDLELKTKGFFASNQSYAQYKSQPEATGADLRVPGLPVFLNFYEAESWIKGKKFKNPPAIVRVWVDLKLIAGPHKTVRLIRNYWNKRVGHEPTDEEIQNHISEKTKIHGEAYTMSHNLELETLLRPFEIVIRPALP